MTARDQSALKIYIVRHAHALDGKDDAVRPLSRRGREQIRQMGRFLKKRRLLTAREFWHSPLVRSRDTAKRLLKRLKTRARLREVKGLLHDDPPTIIAKHLGRVKRSVAVVGHEPHLGALISQLLAGAAKPVRFELKKCAVLALSRKGKRWLILWQVTPEMVGGK